MPQCDRCNLFRSPFEVDRFWSGSYTERTANGLEHYRTLCDDCHRIVVRNS